MNPRLDTMRVSCARPVSAVGPWVPRSIRAHSRTAGLVSSATAGTRALCREHEVRKAVRVRYRSPGDLLHRARLKCSIVPVMVTAATSRRTVGVACAEAGPDWGQMLRMGRVVAAASVLGRVAERAPAGVTLQAASNDPKDCELCHCAVVVDRVMMGV